ncbi:GAF domain-containing protein [Sphingomonas sp. MAH-20]|uniref:GAF domain-containing protein n=1 Tax=Sphingomonas horti TaxID=2682842 RepID=A0A6I4IZ46_9SPHN|nr:MULTISPECIES: adenylate/guanylate cyclase domain-containing protein [Sphingomonas]MBA2918460.1 GAF domain-containing protein [Sphingomonas sp. CGMCC 1.13658]MVO77427.1 GAF domain-containing protein [Sphingomonas horti]
MNALSPRLFRRTRHGEGDDGRALLWRLIWIYQGGCAAAVVISMSLVFLGLEVTGYQWAILLSMLPIAVALYNLPDVWLLRRHAGPIVDAMRAQQAGAATEPLLANGLVRALNLPYFSFLRVTFLHGPLVTVLVFVVTGSANWLVGAGFADWQILAFGATTLFFASPTHAIFEYFAVSRAMEPVIVRFGGALGGTLPPEYRQGLISVRLKSKLLYLAIFVTTLPLIFFAASMVFKVQRMFAQVGVATTAEMMGPFYAWIVGVVLACGLGSVMMALLTARDVSRSAMRLIDDMRLVESGRLNEVRLEVFSTDEYADIFHGFQHMLDSLREEQQILEISHDLAGELQLDVLIARIMTATTELLNAERSTLFLHDPKTGELYSVFAEGDAITEIRLPANRGIAGAVFTTGKAENITDPYSDDRFDQSVDLQTGFRTRSILCQPIVNKHGGRIGVTQVLNKKGAGAFSEKDEARLRAFSAQIAVSLENAKLFDDVLSMKNYNESILESTSNGFVTLDAEGRIVTANTAALEILGVRESLAGRSAADVFAGENRWVIEMLERSAIAGESQLAVDAEIVRATDVPASVNLSAAPLIDAGEQRIGSMLVIEDITAEKRVRSTMARYMSKEVADQLLQAGEDVLGGRDQMVSILFSDVRGFTTIAETIGARETVTMLNEYFTEMVDVILENGGILDKYIGDAMMALFGAPFVGPSDADNALAAANNMLLCLGELNARRARRGKPPLDVGLGVSTGDVIVGNIGSSKRMEYTVIGDSVNLASRLEGANKFYGTRILLSEFTRERLTRPVLTREIDLIRVKGKDFPVAVHESLEHCRERLNGALDDMLGYYGRGLDAYRGRCWAEAKRAFGEACRAVPGDGPSAIYISRCEQFAKMPPPEDWDGVWSLTAK